MSVVPILAGSRPCNLCLSTDARPRYEINDYHIVCCRRCGLCYVGETVSKDDLVRYYGQEYYDGTQAQGYGDYLGQRERRKAHFRSLLPILRRHLRAGVVRVLDVGCAAGFFLEVAREAGWQARGLELSPYSSDYARSLGLDVITGTLEEADLPEGGFDLITMWDVIEHLLDPLAALQKAGRLLSPGGLLALATGDISGATAQIYGSRWALLAPPGHLFYFSRRTLFAMLRRAGFEPLQWQSDGAFLLNPREGDDEAGGLRALVDRLHHNRWIGALLRRLRLGSIITVYAKKCGTR